MIALINVKSLSLNMVLIALTLLLTTNSHAQGLRRGGNISRSRALATLKGCADRPITLGCNEETAEYLIKLYKRGDKSLLKPLLDAGRSRDGALSEALGTFYAEVLWKDPRRFLESLRARSQKEQHDLSHLAGGTDGSGMPDDMLRDVRAALRRMATQRRSRLAPIAQICLSEVNASNASIRKL